MANETHEQALRKLAHLAIIATGANDPVTAVEELIRQHNQMREGIYKNAPPRQFSGGLPCATPERDSYLAQFGITEQIWGFCCNG